MAGYWPRSLFTFLWTSTSTRSIKAQKKDLANIQPSSPYTWSITHILWYKINNDSLLITIAVKRLNCRDKITNNKTIIIYTAIISI